MNFRLTAILFGVVLLLVVGLLVSTLIDDKPATDAVLMAALEGQKPADIDIVEIVRSEPEEKLVMARTGKDRWELREPSAGRVDASLVNRIITELLKLKPTISKDLTGDPALHGLDKPGVKITLRAKTKSATLHLGDTTIGGDKAVTFVAAGDRPTTPLAVKRGDLSSLFKETVKDGKSAALVHSLSEFRLKRLLGVDIYNALDGAKGLKIKAGSKEMALSHVGSDWTFDQPAGYGAVDIAGDATPVANATVFTGLRSLFATLSGLAVSTPEDFIESPEAPEKYGLTATDPNLVRIELTPKDGPPDVLIIGKKIEGPGLTKYYAQVPGEKCVVKVSAERLEAIINTVANPKVLQDRTLVKDLDVPRIDAVTISAGGSVANLRKVPVNNSPRWVLYGGSSDPQFAGAAITTLLAELAVSRVATDVIVPPNDAAFATAEIKSEIKIWIDGLEKAADAKAEPFPAEPKLKGDATVTLLFGKTEGESTFVRRILADGTKTDLKVPTALAVKAAKKRIEYFDLKFKEFATNTAKKLTFNRGADIFEIARSDAPDADFPLGKWTFAKPDNLKGQIADTDKVGGGTSLGAGLIGTLATLSATSVVTETPTDAELKTWGLDATSPRLKATVELDGKEKEKERVYHFGHETADKAYVHFREPGRTVVYLVPRVSLDALLTEDVRDRTPYRVDLNQVKSVRVRWWKKKAVTEETFERTGNDWTVKVATPYKVDAVRMLTLLNALRAPKPLAVLGAVKTEHGFGAGDADPMEVAAFDAAGKPLFEVTLGSETDGGAGIFFWNAATKEAASLNNAYFKPFKDAVDSLKAK